MQDPRAGQRVTARRIFLTIATFVWSVASGGRAVASDYTESSPTAGGDLPTLVSPTGGVVFDLIGTNGARVISQLAADDLFEGYFGGSPGTIGTQTGFTSDLLNTLGGGLSEAAVRLTVSDGDTALGEFDYQDNHLLVNGVDFGDWSDVPAQQVDEDGVVGGSGTSDGGFRDSVVDTGWFYLDAAGALTTLYNSLTSTGEAEYQLQDDDPSDNYFDFTQGVSVAYQGSGLAPTGLQVWEAGVDPWETGGNWDSGIAPTSQTLTIISNGGTAVIGAGISGATQALIVGNDSGETGYLTISGGGQLATGGDSGIAQRSGSTGAVTVTGTGSAWNTAGTVYVGGDVNGAGGTGTLTIAAGGSVTVGGLLVVRSPGTVNVNAGGTLALPGAESLVEGVLNLADTGAVSVASGGVLRVASSQDMTWDGVVSGAGGLTKAGAGMLTLGGTNEYTGATTVSAGTFKLGGAGVLPDTTVISVAGGATFDLGGNDETVGSLASAGSVTLGAGTLTTGGLGTSTTFSGVISGAGGVTKTGAGTLTLSGANDYTGATTVSVGTLKLGGGGVLADTTALSVTSGATFDLDDNEETVGSLAGAGNVTLGAGTLGTGGLGTSTTFSGVISGAGGVTKAGAGTLTLSGANGFTGPLTIGAGTVVLNGSVGGNVITNSALLQGTGTIGGDLTVNVGGTLAPGGSIGTTTVLGDYVLSGTLDVDVDKPDNSTCLQDLVDVTGSATLNSGSQITVTKLSGPGVFLNDDTFTIITADGGITDNGAAVTTASAFLSFTGGIVGNTYVLTTQVTSNFASQASHVNLDLAKALDADSPPASGDYADIFNELLVMGAAQFNTSVRQMNAEPYLAMKQALTRNTQVQADEIASYLRLRRTESPHLAAAEPNEMSEPGINRKVNFFAKPLILTYDQTGSDARIGLDSHAYGVQIGADKWLCERFIVGLSSTYAHTRATFGQNRGQGDVDTFRVGPYASIRGEKAFLDLMATYGFHRSSVAREVRFGSVSRRAQTDYNAHDVSIYAGGGLDFKVCEVDVSPTVSLQYVAFRQDGFQESGADSINLHAKAETFFSLRSKAGLRVSRSIHLGKATVVPEVFGGWVHEYLAAHNMEARFSGGSANFRTHQDGIANDSAFFGAGASLRLKDATSLFMRYEYQTSSADRSHLFRVGLKIDF